MTERITCLVKATYTLLRYCMQILNMKLAGLGVGRCSRGGGQ